ncbi:hypothetical protein llap_8116 [Limosa lapponica baueri]|uniref:Uncharacterized protein n=1 Tax=Limosa lapponica baueri TaxID=1758121 RepID=A0A2I0U668_LIMLA|nr:hypothetical protein llap_8116 [Limosa lapponica baueri]
MPAAGIQRIQRLISWQRSFRSNRRAAKGSGRAAAGEDGEREALADPPGHLVGIVVPPIVNPGEERRPGATSEQGSGEKHKNRDLPQEGPSVSALVTPSWVMQIVPDVMPGALPEDSIAQWIARAGEGTRLRASQRELHKLSGAFWGFLA